MSHLFFAVPLVHFRMQLPAQGHLMVAQARHKQLKRSGNLGRIRIATLKKARPFWHVYGILVIVLELSLLYPCMYRSRNEHIHAVIGMVSMKLSTFLHAQPFARFSIVLTYYHFRSWNSIPKIRCHNIIIWDVLC